MGVRWMVLGMAALFLTSLAVVGCSSEEKVIKIGAAVSETGRYEEEGRLTREGYLLWEEWVNEEYGGVKVGDYRYEVELVLYDDKSEPGHDGHAGRAADR